MMALKEFRFEAQPIDAGLRPDLESVLRGNPTVDGTALITRTLAMMISKFQQVKTRPNSLTPLVDYNGAICSSQVGHSECNHPASLKERVLARSNYLCECCGEWAHNIYVDAVGKQQHALDGDDLSAAIALCSRCLEFIERDPITGRTRTDEVDRQVALSQIYGKGSEDLVFHLLTALDDCKRMLSAALT